MSAKTKATFDREPAVTSYGVAVWLADQGWELRSASRNSVLPSDLWVKGEARLIVLTGGRYSLLSDGQRTVVSLPETSAALRWLGKMGAGVKKSDRGLSDPVPPGRPTG